MKILKILEINHFDVKGKLLYQNKNLDNILHKQGEEFILRCLFGGVQIPNEYYLGLDSRTQLSRNDNISQLSNLEPSLNGYTRQTVENSNFSFVTNAAGDFQANSPTVLFRATSGSWGPVRNIFLASSPGYSGSLISTVPLGNNIIVSNNEVISLRIGLAISNL
jgi:hypothetical protein